MVHEAMVLEYSGRPLALMELAAMVKLAVFALLLANFVVPAGMATPGKRRRRPWSLRPSPPSPRLPAAMGALALLESSMAKLRFYGLPEYFFGALFLGLTSLGLGLLVGLL